MMGLSASQGGDAQAPLPLAGVRIIAVEQYGAGPFATMYLSDMGAEVIKIEPPARGRAPGGDSSRQSGPFFLAENESHFFQTFNLGKKSLILDIKSPEGREILHRLVATADAVVNNLRGDQPASLGVDYETLGKVKPSVVCAHLSGYGRTGERVTRPAYDYLIQAEGGFMDVTGEPDGAPTRMGLSVVDYLTGITTAFALTAALFGAARSGKGRNVDVTLYDVAMHQLTYPATWYLNEGYAVERRPRSGHPMAVPCELFPTKDGNIFIMCILPKFWERLCQIIGLEDLIEDARFKTPKDRFTNREELVALIDEALKQSTTAEWMSLMSGELPAAPMLSLPQALDNPYFIETGGIQTIDHPDREGLRVLSNPIRLDSERVPARPAPRLGQDTDEILKSLGYDDAAIVALRDKSVI